MRKRAAIAVVALLTGTLMLPSYEASARGGGLFGTRPRRFRRLRLRSRVRLWAHLWLRARLWILRRLLGV
jgi:hypothetical protein